MDQFILGKAEPVLTPARVVNLGNLLALSSRPTSTDPAERETEGEWRDPENASLCHADTRCSTQAAYALSCATPHGLKANILRLASGNAVPGNGTPVELPVSATWAGHILGISPLLPRLPLRGIFVVGRDDRFPSFRRIFFRSFSGLKVGT